MTSAGSRTGRNQCRAVTSAVFGQSLRQLLVSERLGSVREPYVQSLEKVSDVSERLGSVREPYVQSLEKVTSMKGLDQSVNLMYSLEKVSDVNERPGSVREPYVQSLESNVNERTESVREPYVQSLEKVTSLKGLDQSANLMYRVWRK